MKLARRWKITRHVFELRRETLEKRAVFYRYVQKFVMLTQNSWEALVNKQAKLVKLPCVIATENHAIRRLQNKGVKLNNQNQK